MAETEIWQVSTREGVFEADLPTLKQWVGEGVVQPTDRVRKGALKWIEAGRAPALRRVFSGEESPEPAEPAEPAAEPSQAAVPHARMAVPAAHEAVAQAASPASASLPANAWGRVLPSQGFGPAVTGGAVAPSAAAQAQVAGDEWDEPSLGGPPSLSSSCYFHPVAAATLVCRSCSTTFCRSCPNKVGGSSVLLCTVCGGFCDPLEILRERLALYERQGEGFGIADFKEALAYPFRHLASLLGGALLYGFLLLAGARGQLLASALVFGCISLVVRRVAYGNLKRDFMPDFGEFSFWDDVVVPCSLGVGVTLVTLGPTLLLVCALLFGWVAGAQPRPEPLAQQAAEAAGRQGVTREDMGTLVNGGTAEQEAELEKKVNAMRPSAQLARGLEESKKGDETAFGVLRQFTAHPGLILVLGLASLAWAVFYHPMALLVAGWTESLKSVLNPLVGLDTMRHMGGTYFKAFLMYLAAQFAALVMTFAVGLVTAPFDMPFVGNLPGTFLSGVVTFYTSLVIACVLGLALFKSADSFGIELG